jgi:hypothetical protein
MLRVDATNAYTTLLEDQQWLGTCNASGIVLTITLLREALADCAPRSGVVG